jgi:UDP-glucose 4-epimerase
MSNRVLVTGGTGFIGSHVVTSLIKKGYKVGIVDDLRNSKFEVLGRLKEITRSEIEFFKVDILVAKDVAKVFDDFQPTSVIHLAAEKSPSESVLDPIKYYKNNIMGLCNVLDSMRISECDKIVFSSSATVYGTPSQLPITEQMLTAPNNAYGRSKLFGESLIKDWCACSSTRGSVSLRYFNPVGAHQSGLIGENPEKAENIFPKIFQSINDAVPLKIYGDDYNTRDGTGERDFIHVMDLADAHVSVLAGLLKKTGYDFFNVGTGVGTTVLELVTMMSKVSGIIIPTEIVTRRLGDVGSAFADATLIRETYGWSAKYDLESMCRDSWNWANTK